MRCAARWPWVVGAGRRWGRRARGAARLSLAVRTLLLQPSRTGLYTVAGGRERRVAEPGALALSGPTLAASWRMSWEARRCRTPTIRVPSAGGADGRGRRDAAAGRRTRPPAPTSAATRRELSRSPGGLAGLASRRSRLVGGGRAGALFLRPTDSGQQTAGRSLCGSRSGGADRGAARSVLDALMWSRPAARRRSRPREDANSWSALRRSTGVGRAPGEAKGL